tara:strand:+ start:462 stop:1190 length:729 start_codon:yes stop_codon:yes gene_type:complete
MPTMKKRIEDFSKQLKAGTKKSHTAAENTSFVASFLRGVVSEENYRQLVANFYFIYHAMETEVERLKEDDFVGPMRLNGLPRQQALAEDCEYFWGADWRDKIYPTEATQQYINRIKEVAHENPKLLIGHHYTRYMGDLSGGVILGNITKNALKLKDKGLAFYDFPEITDKKGFKDSYRSVLDNFLPVDQQDVNAIIVEANYAFRLNMYMFEEIQGDATKGFISYACGYATSRLSYFFKVAGG